MKSPLPLLLFVVASAAAAAPGDTPPPGTDRPPTASAKATGAAQPSLWARWHREAGTGGDAAPGRGTALLQRLRSVVTPGVPASGSAMAVPARPIVIDATATSTAAAPLPARICPGCESHAAETAPASGLPDAVPARTPSWRVGVDRTTDDPNPAATRPTRMRVTVTREWAL